jgi:hypothetical protein
MSAPHRGLADLWAVSNLVQRVAWLGRARIVDAQVKDHAVKDWADLPAKVCAALSGVR